MQDITLSPTAPVTVHDHYARASAELRLAGQDLQHHRVFGMVRDLDDLRLFMRWHVFAVWDFMSLVKRLQIDLTCVSLPWMPPRHPKAARLINEIVLGEESDETLSDGHASHYDLYLEAMREVGVEPVEVGRFLEALGNGCSVSEALRVAHAPAAVADFVRATLQTADTGSTYEVLGSFFYGRENVIPSMFSALLAEWAVDESTVPTFVYYLKRHIELDGDAHGPAAEAIIDELVADDLERRLAVIRAAVSAVRARIGLWDALADTLAQRAVVAA